MPPSWARSSGSIVVALGGGAATSPFVLGIIAGLAALLGFMACGIRTFTTVNRFSEIRFPRTPPSANPPR